MTKYAIIDITTREIIQFFNTLKEVEEFNLAEYVLERYSPELSEEIVNDIFKDYRLIEYNIIAKPEAKVVIQSHWNKNLW